MVHALHTNGALRLQIMQIQAILPYSNLNPDKFHHFDRKEVKPEGLLLKRYISFALLVCCY